MKTKRNLYMMIFWWSVVICLVIAYGMADAAEPKREWFSFMMDGSTCIDVKALDFKHAQCVLEVLAKEDIYKVAEALEGRCPGILAEQYYYDFTFKDCLD